MAITHGGVTTKCFGQMGGIITRKRSLIFSVDQEFTHSEWYKDDSQIILVICIRSRFFIISKISCKRTFSLHSYHSFVIISSSLKFQIRTFVQ